MKTQLEEMMEKLRFMSEEIDDDDFTDEIDNALLFLENAIDRLTAISEEINEWTHPHQGQERP